MAALVADRRAASSPPSGSRTSIVVLFAVATAITLLPAILSLLGDRIDAGRIVGRRRAAKPAEATAWWRLAHRISARPWPYLVVGSLLLLALAAPALSLNTGFPDAGDNPKGQTERKAYELLADGFGPGFNAPLLVVADLQGSRTGRRGHPRAGRAHRRRPRHRGGRRAAGQRRRRHRRAAHAAHHRAGRPGHRADPRAGPFRHPGRGVRDRRDRADARPGQAAVATSCRCSSARSWPRPSCC